MDIAYLLSMAPRMDASDVHLAVGAPPTLRIKGELVPVPKAPKLTAETVRGMVYEILTDTQKARFERDLNLDMAIEFKSVGRFRANIFLERAGIGAAFRLIPGRIPSLEELGMPEILYHFARAEDGLVLVTGPTGMGKSTTLAAMIDLINAERRRHIVTIEDPIEFVHTHGKSIIHQREVGPHVHSFADALRAALREDPDVILIGEMRDLETIALAITAAETGHLVFATLHTSGAPQTIDRIIDVFPEYQQEQIRGQIAECLRGVVSQVLLPSVDGKGRVAVMEVMVANPAIRNLIRENKTYQMQGVIQTGGREGMLTMDNHLAYLVQMGRVSRETALRRIRDPQILRSVTGGIQRDFEPATQVDFEALWQKKSQEALSAMKKVPDGRPIATNGGL